MRNNGVQKFVVMCHVITVFRLLVKPETQIIYGVLFANSNRFKQIQHLFRIDTPVTDISTVSDVNGIVRMDRTGGFLLFICAGVGLLEKKDNAVFRGIVFVTGNGISTIWCCLKLRSVSFELLQELCKEII